MTTVAQQVSRCRQLWVSAWRLLRLRPFDSSTESGRSSERLRRMALTSLTAGLARALRLVAPLVTIPLTLNYLGKERYGLWMAATSATAIFAFADLGLGNGLLSALSRANGRNDRDEMKRCVSSAFFVLTTIALALITILAGLHQLIPWHRVLKLSDVGLASDVSLVVLICFLVCFVNIPLGIIQRTQMAMQEGYLRNLWEGLGSLANILVIVIAVRLEVSLPVLVLSVSGFGLFITLLNGGLYFRAIRRNLLPVWRSFHWPTGKRLLRSGSHYVLISLATGFMLHSDTTWVAVVLGLESAATFSVPARLASLLGSVVNMLVMPLWPANGEALARGDVDWVRRTTNRMQYATVGVTAAAGVFFVAFGGWALRLWIGPEFEVPRSLLAALALWAVAISYVSPLFMVLNSANKTWEQVRLFAVFVPVAALAKVTLLHQVGVAGVVWGTSIPYVLLVVIPVRRIAIGLLSGYRTAPSGSDEMP